MDKGPVAILWDGVKMEMDMIHRRLDTIEDHLRHIRWGEGNGYQINQMQSMHGQQQVAQANISQNSSMGMDKQEKPNE
jgi:hypothetical protein